MKVTVSYGMSGEDWSIDNSQMRWRTRLKCRVRMTRLWGLNPFYSPSRALMAGYKEAERLARKQVQL